MTMNDLTTPTPAPKSTPYRVRHAGPWTDERIERLKKLVAEKMTATEIAKRLGGGISRCAVIGQAKRRGLTLQGPQSTAARLRDGRQLGDRRGNRKPHKPPAPRSPGASKPKLPVPPKYAPIEQAPSPIAQRCTLLELTEFTCRWPHGTPGTPDFYFCGAGSMPGLPYCTQHHRMAYRPASPRPISAYREQFRRAG